MLTLVDGQAGKAGGMVYMKGSIGESDTRFGEANIVRLLGMFKPGIINRGGVHRGEPFSGVGKITAVEFVIGMGAALIGAIEALVTDRVFNKVTIETHAGIAAKGEADTATKITKTDTFVNLKYSGFTFCFSKEGLETMEDDGRYYSIVKLSAQFEDIIQKRCTYMPDGSVKKTDVLGIRTTKDTAKLK